jgi:hypothetical protein
MNLASPKAECVACGDIRYSDEAFNRCQLMEYRLVAECIHNPEPFDVAHGRAALQSYAFVFWRMALLASVRR